MLLLDTLLPTGDIVTDLVLNGFALPLLNHVAHSLGPGGADLLHDGGALLLVPGGALLPILVGALLLVDGLLNCAGNIDALELGDSPAFLLKLLTALLVNVAGLLTLAAVLGAALPGGHGLLLGPLGDAALALRGVRANLVRHGRALAPLHSLVHGPRNLLANLLGNLGWKEHSHDTDDSNPNEHTHIPGGTQELAVVAESHKIGMRHRREQEHKGK